MTQTQQDIVNSLINEFEKFNTKTSKVGNLIDIAEMLGDIDNDAKIRQEVAINNKYQSDVMMEYLKSDLALLKQDLEQLGLKARLLMSGFGIIIETPRYDDIIINYRMKIQHKVLSDMRTRLDIYKGFEMIESYIDFSSIPTRFYKLSDLTSNNNFKLKIRQRYESTLKNK